MSRSMKLRWDIFCAIVDNFGDVGFCWRLARQLVNEYGLEVRLWVDDLASISNELDVEEVQPAAFTCGRKIGLPVGKGPALPRG